LHYDAVAGLDVIEYVSRHEDVRRAGRRRRSGEPVDRIKPGFRERRAYCHRKTSERLPQLPVSSMDDLDCRHESPVPRCPLSIHPVERPIRTIALNRKNALFAGSDEGAEN